MQIEVAMTKWRINFNWGKTNAILVQKGLRRHLQHYSELV